MRINIDIDDSKLSKLMELGNYKTKNEAINAAIDETIKFLTRQKMANMRGTFQWEGDLEEWRKSRFPEWDGSDEGL